MHEQGKVIQKAFAFTSHTDEERCLLRENVWLKGLPLNSRSPILGCDKSIAKCSTVLENQIMWPLPFKGMPARTLLGVMLNKNPAS